MKVKSKNYDARCEKKYFTQDGFFSQKRMELACPICGKAQGRKNIIVT